MGFWSLAKLQEAFGNKQEIRGVAYTERYHTLLGVSKSIFAQHDVPRLLLGGVLREVGDEADDGWGGREPPGLKVIGSCWLESLCRDLLNLLKPNFHLSPREGLFIGADSPVAQFPILGAILS